jgi:hypothetical protein
MSKLFLNFGNLLPPPDLIVNKSQNRKRKTNSENCDVDAEATAILWPIIGSEDLGAGNSSDVGKHDNPGHVR